MKKLTSTLILTAVIGMPPVTAWASGEHAGGHHETMPMKHNGGHGEMHRHASWEKPPKVFASKKWNRWSDSGLANQGKGIYQQQCASCHGASGMGDGPIASSLPHRPADLTNHFHKAPGDGDGYLYWRISEGGAVEPFRSMQSAMPAFKESLSEDERWAVLTYVHQEFHKGFQDGDQQARSGGHKNDGHSH